MGTVYSEAPLVEARSSGVELSERVAWDKLDDLIATLLVVRSEHAASCSLTHDEFRNLLKNYVNDAKC